MRVLVACEFSGIVRDAFIARGHDAISCDLLPSERPGPHVIGDVLDMLGDGFDLMIAHPPCTYLTNSGVRWLWKTYTEIDDDRWSAMQDSARFFRALYDAPIEHVAIENPVMHSYGREAVGIGYPAFSIQPWQFGEGEIKRTCFWTRNLPDLVPTNIVDGRAPRVHHASPGADRWKERSRTLPGIADAIADQWGSYVQSRLDGRRA